MIRLEDLRPGLQVEGLIPGAAAQIVAVEAPSDNSRLVIYRNADGRPEDQTLFRSDEHRLAIAQEQRQWSFDADPAAFKLGLEAYRIRLAHLFDPMMAVHTSDVTPLPHQISAVYEAMLPRQPLRYLLADDPGAGKTIMAGLLVRELVMRADARRVLIVSPGSLSEQWQDELIEKFGLRFELFSREKQEQSHSRNYFAEQDFLIARLDMLSRNETYQELLQQTEWDLVIFDEAHKLSAHYFGEKLEETARFKLAKLLGGLTRHLLLMTATPHNGKEADFQLFLSLLDSDRFSGKFRDGRHEKPDVTDLMRRMVKEELLTFEGKHLFPKRFAYTVNYTLSDAETALYEAVTDYVRNEMGRADRVGGKKKNTVGFALTLLQRRLASSPQAIYSSLTRRRKRLETRLEEAIAETRQDGVRENLAEYIVTRRLDVPDNLDEAEDELGADEYEGYADRIVDEATAAATIPELQAEILVLRDLEERAADVVRSGNDRKWHEFRRLLQENEAMHMANGRRRKLIVFTEHRDTLNYLVRCIEDMLGSSQAVVTIHGGTARDDRRRAQQEFRQNEDVLVMVATDAAGEGVNLQNANLMVNYDLPWNPNRIEQRFGRIHRIGQREACHLWNLVASGTREGEVFNRLLDKLEVQLQALGGRVFNVLGEAFDDVSLKDLLIQAIRSNDREETRAWMEQVVDRALDTQHLVDLHRRNALVDNHMSLDDLFGIREEMDKAEARKLQPHFIKGFFCSAFSAVGGQFREVERSRLDIRHVPAELIERDRQIGSGRNPVVRKYERVCFERETKVLYGYPDADLMHPGHPLLAALTDVVFTSHRTLLKRGAVLVDPADEGDQPRMLFMIEHAIREAAGDRPAEASRRLVFVTIAKDGTVAPAGAAPHLGLEPITAEQLATVSDVVSADWVTRSVQSQALAYATEHLAPEHMQEVAGRRQRQADKQLAAVRERLIKEIQHYSARALKLAEEVRAGKQPRMQPENARRKAEELAARLRQREAELETMRTVVSSAPNVVGAALVIPRGLLDQRAGRAEFCVDPVARARIERIAMQAVLDAEHALGRQTKDVSAENCGWDITAYIPRGDELPLLRHIEVKGRAKGQTTITVTRNEISEALNQGDKYFLAIVIVDGDAYEGPFYVQRPFLYPPDWADASKNLDLASLLERAVTAGKCV